MQRDEETKKRRDEVKNAHTLPSSSTSSLRLSVSSSLAFLVCIALLLAFATTSWHAWLHKCATYDEPLHLVGAWLQTHDADFRCNPEDPPLWKYYLALGTRRGDLQLDRQSGQWIAMLHVIDAQQWYVTNALYQTPGNDADALIRSARDRMLLLGVLVGALTAWWAWRWRGPVAAVVAAAAFCFDPNFLAHAPLIKNDVIICLLFLALMAAVWLSGERATLLRCAAIALIVGAALATKFSGVLAIPILALALLARALLPAAWPVLGWTARTTAQRLAASAAIFAAAVVVSYVAIWACYGFRFNTAAGQPADLDDVAQICIVAQGQLDHGAPVDATESQMRQWAGETPTPPIVRFTLWAAAHHLLPQAWLRGLLYTYGTMICRRAFLCGQVRLTGWWYYFPLAMAVKTPLATLIALALALWAGLAFRRHGGRTPMQSWPIIAAVLAPALYMLMALRSHQNVGIRHVLVVYPFLFIFLGVVAADAWRRWGKPALWIIAILVLGLSVETSSAYPDFLPFFNVAAGGYRGGAKILGDSNIDWGQDLPALADWQRRHPDKQLYLCYFGAPDPRYYGIHYVCLPGGFAPPDQLPMSGRPRVLAFSVTALQGEYYPAQLRATYETFVRQTPIAILGGSIYLYEGK